MIRKLVVLAGLAMMISGGDCWAGYLISATGVVLVAVATMKGEQE